MNVSLLVLIFVFAILIQFIVDRIKTIFGANATKYIPADIIALLVGVLFAFMFDIDVFVMSGLNSSIPYVGKIISGLIISAGAPALHELIANIRAERESLSDKGDD